MAQRIMWIAQALQALCDDERGQGLTEYALVSVFISVALLVGLDAMGGDAQGLLSRAQSILLAAIR